MSKTTPGFIELGFYVDLFDRSVPLFIEEINKDVIDEVEADLLGDDHIVRDLATIRREYEGKLHTILYEQHKTTQDPMDYHPMDYHPMDYHPMDYHWSNK